ncbi:MAG TPA: hypothetical protein VJ891_13065 [Casimicrobiaceae bacterium]|nr:hypothetical protein [Casimicrobiaceae bacterium]
MVDDRPTVPSRRRLLTAGASVAPVLLTLASRPVLAGQCMCASAMAGSLNGSVMHMASTCYGRTPTYWSSTHSWPTPFYANGSSATDFHSTTTGFATGVNGNFGTQTMMHVINQQGTNSAYNVGAYISAAILNARMGYTPVLTEANVRNMWNQYAATGQFSPSAGIYWNGNQIIQYINTTMA